MRKPICLFILCFVCLMAHAQPRLSAENVDAVLQAMTLEEKAALLVGANQGVLYGGSAETIEYQLPESARMYDNRMGVGGSTYAFPHLGNVRRQLGGLAYDGHIHITDGKSELRDHPARFLQ